MLSKIRLLRSPVSSGSRILNVWESKNFYSDKKNGSGKNNRGKTPPLIQTESCISSNPPKTSQSSVPVDSVSEKNTNWQDSSKSKKFIRNWSIVGGTFALAGVIYGIWNSDFIKQKDDIVINDTKKAKNSRKLVPIPSLSQSIPDNVQYLLIGGGTASFAAFRAIKSADPTARVLVISAEGYLPHMRPPLSKELWFSDDAEMTKSLNFQQWNGTARSLFYEPEPFYTPVEELNTAKNGGISLARGWKVKSINVSEKKSEAK